jgi:RNA polymerase sigma-70 factor (ECF subfamily)
MIGFGPAHRFFLYRPPADMRKGFDGLSGLVRRGLGRDPLSGDVFVFVNRRRTHLKLLAYKIVKLIMRYVRDPSEALDVAQEAFLKAYRAAPSFRGDSAFYTWLYRIAINTAKNHLVAAGRKPLTYNLDTQDPEQSVVLNELRELDTPEGLAQSEEIREAINRAINGLPEELRTAILLREIEGLSYEEIAQTMECPVGTVRSRIFRAREAIDKAISPLL